jgi:hypothetical protein
MFSHLSYNYKPNELFYNELIYPGEVLNKFGYMAKRINTISIDNINSATEKHDGCITLIKNKQTFFDYFQKQFKINDA